MSDCLWPHGLQHTRLPCLPLSHEICSNSCSLIRSVILFNHLILRCPQFLLPTIFSNQLVLHIRLTQYWNFNFSISPSNQYSGLSSFRIDWFDLFAVQKTLRVFSNITIQKHQFLALSLLSGPTLTSLYDYCKKHRFDYADLCQQGYICFLPVWGSLHRVTLSYRASMNS